MRASAATASSGLRLRSIATRGILVPLTFTLGTSAALVRAVPLLLLDLATEEGVTGRSYLFCYSRSGAQAVAAHVAEAAELIVGRALSPLALGNELSRRFALLGVTGTVRMALSAIDMAMWDALAVALGQPVAALLGASPGPVQAYDSRGLGLMEPGPLAAEAEALLEKGLRAVKLRLGHPTLAQDMAAALAVRRRVPDAIKVMVDYNQALTPAEAIMRGRALQAEGIFWLEEPVRHDDLAGNAAIARALELPLQIGENFNGPEALLQAVEARACDYVMPDVARIGGVTGWMRAAGIAAARGIEMSSHLMPETSLHLLRATPTAHWLEYVDWADAFLEQPLRLDSGMAICPDRPGFGIAWDEARLARLEPV